MLAAALFATFAVSAPPAPANSIGDFFKRLGRTVTKWRKPEAEPEKKTPKKTSGASGKEASTESKAAPGNASVLPPAPTSTPSPTPVDIRPAALAPPSHQRRDVPYGVAVPSKPGFVTSPYAPQAGYVDVRAFPRSTEVLDPFTGKIFLTP